MLAQNDAALMHLTEHSLWWAPDIQASQSIQSIKQTIIVHPKVDQRAGQLSLPHVGITKTEKVELKRKTDEQINPVNGLEPWYQSNRQKQTKVEDKIFWKGRFWAQSETVKKWWKVIAVCSKLNRPVQTKVAERGILLKTDWRTVCGPYITSSTSLLPYPVNFRTF